MNKTNLLTRDDVNDIIFALDNTTKIFRECRLFDQSVGESHLLDPKKYIHKTTESLTDILDTTVQIHPSGETPRIFFKIWIEWDKVPSDLRHAKRNDLNLLYGNSSVYVLDDDYTTSLDYEAIMYQFITDNIILRNVSPNFVPILLNQTCNLVSIVENIRKFRLTFNSDYATKFERLDHLFVKLLQLNRMFNDKLSMRFIMTGSAPNVMSMYDFCVLLRGNQNSPDFIKTLKRDVLSNGLAGDFRTDEYKAILFQFFYTFYVLYKYKIVHNDNHFGNVLIQILDKPVTFDIDVHGKIVTFSTQYVVKFFDWDRAYREGEATTNNITTRRFLTELRSIAKFIPNRDFSQFLCEMRRFGISAFDQLLIKLVPTYTIMKFTNIAKGAILIENVVTLEFRKWLVAHPDSIFTSNTGQQYVTIDKKELEKIPAIDLKAISSAIDDKFDKIGFYANIKSFFFEIDGDNLLIIPGKWECKPIVDELVNNIEDYFTRQYLFRILIDNLRIRSTAVGVYRYSIN